MSVYMMLKTFLCATLLALITVGCKEAIPDSGSGHMSIELNVDIEALKLGQVVLESTLVNNSGEGIRFLPWNTPFDSAITGRFLEVEELHSSGERKELAYIGPMIKRMAPTTEDYVVVEDGAILHNSIDITKSYNFCAERHYSIGFTNDLYDGDYNAISVDAIRIEFIASKKFKECFD